MTQTHRQEIRVPGMPEPISHFTHVVRAGRLVFVSGCVATDANGKTVGGNDIVAQTRQVHENIKRCLAAAGSGYSEASRSRTVGISAARRAGRPCTRSR
jgi:enamine deaminase RidA (YjgF/YER057c/UK114 family)